LGDRAREADLIARAVAGDGDAFAELAEPYEQKVYNLAYRMSRDREDAFDLAQEVFLKVYRALPRFRGNSSFSTWLYRITSNTCLDLARKHKRVPNTISLDDPVETTTGELRRQVADSSSEPERTAVRAEAASEIMTAISALPAEQRLSIVYRELEGLSYEEIAEALGCSLGTVKSRISRARAALKERLAARELLPTAGVYSVDPAPEVARASRGRAAAREAGGRASGSGSDGPRRARLGAAGPGAATTGAGPAKGADE